MSGLRASTSIEVWKKYTILIVDDEPSIVAELNDLLSLEGFLVTTAASGEEGMRCLLSSPAQLIISDQKMAGGMSGTQFLRQVKAQYPEAVTMILSAFSEPEYLMDAVNDANVYQYILKPWNQEDLIKRIAQALQYFHAQAENRYLANANRRLLTTMAQMETYSLFGDFSTALYDRFFPVLQAKLLSGDDAATSTSNSNGTSLAQANEWAHLGTIVSRLGQIGAHYHLPPGYQTCSLVDVIKRCVADAKCLTSDKAIIWHEDYADAGDLSLQVETFEYAVKAVIENAVVHGALTDGSQAEIFIRVYTRHKPEKLLVIEVADSGPGCEADVDVFSPLYSTCVQQSVSWIRANHLADYNFEPYNHVGLGLSIARWCIAQHNGAIELTNPGKSGAMFRVSIPISEISFV